MTISEGTRLGPYRILAPAGSGGMGEVYKASDTRLDRTVAIKVLPAHVAADADMRERFEREARAVASLNHPHICTLHDVGHQDGIDYLVMEFLQGETLAHRLDKGALPMADALQYATQIADALDKAHRAGIVHRDLKPGNIMLTKSGAKLLDFGLAKTAAGATGAPAGPLALATAIAHASMMPTGATPLTVEGAILGTLQYMSPEQLEGREADARTDIFAFGAVLYEMVTGRRAFQGKSQVSLMAAIMDQDPPPIADVQPLSPPLLDHFVRTCLAKSPDARWQHAGDLVIQLRLIAGHGNAAEPPPVAAPGRGRLFTWATVAAALAAAVTAPVVFRLARIAPPAPARVVFQISTASAPSPLQIAISPDGSRLVAPQTTARGEASALWVRSLANLEGQFLPRTENAVFPFWSPDGRAVGFFADGTLKRADLAGGTPLSLADSDAGYGGTWNEAGVVVFAPTQASPLFRVPAAGGVPTQVTELDASEAEVSHRHPFFLPDGDHFLFTAVSSAPDKSAIYVGSLSSGERRRLVASNLKAVFTPPGFLLFMRDDSTLMAQALDPDRFELRDEPFPAVAEDIGVNLGNGAAGFTASANGVLAYRGGGINERVLTWFDEKGTLLETTGSALYYQNPAISPDGRFVAITQRTLGSTSDIWLLDIARNASSRFTFDGAADDAAVWSPDGRRIVFSSNRGGQFDLYVKDAGGVGTEELVFESDHPKFAEDWSKDGRLLLYRSSDPKTRSDVWVLPLNGDRQPRPLLQTTFNEFQAQFSPDGRWLAYTSDESGRPEVYVQRFPPSGGKWQVSTTGGVQPVWSEDGRRLYFFSFGGNDAMAATVAAIPDGNLSVGASQRIPLVQPVSRTIDRNSWDASPDGRRFLVNVTSNQAGVAAGQVTPITVVLNWMAGR